MNISEKLEYYTDNISYKFVKFNIIKMFQTHKELKRYINREFKGDRNLIVSSEVLRLYAIELTKLFKKINRECEFDKFRQTLENHKRVDNKVFTNECKNIQEKMNLVKNLQPLVLELNYYSTIVYMLEELDRQNKEKSDDLFNDAILNALIEAY